MSRVNTDFDLSGKAEEFLNAACGAGTECITKMLSTESFDERASLANAAHEMAHVAQLAANAAYQMAQKDN